MSESLLFSGSIPANYDRFLGPNLFEPYALDLKERLKNDACKIMLEVACGTGRVTNHLVTILGEKGSITATDVNGDMIEVAKTKVVDERVKWLVADAQLLPFNNETFDHVICQFGVMFFPDKPGAFKEAYRVLAKKGKFVFNTWASLEDNRSARLVKDVMDEVLKDEPSEFFQKGPHSFHDVNLIKGLLTNAGFKDIVIEQVEKTAEFKTREEFISGFIEGTPVGSFLQKKDPLLKEDMKRRLSEALEKEFCDTTATKMVAYVCTGVKE